MMAYLMTQAKAQVGGAITWFLSKLKDFFANLYASHKGMRQGHDFVLDNRLNHLIKTTLDELSESPTLLPEFQDQSFRDWILNTEFVEPFIELLIARRGGNHETGRVAAHKLAKQYERATGVTWKRADGPIERVLSTVIGMRQASAKSRSDFESALDAWGLAQLQAMQHPELQPFPTDAHLVRLRNLAKMLLGAGRVSNKMPTHFALLTLEVHEDSPDHAKQSINTEQLLDSLEQGENLTLFGEGGIGKTTFLLDLTSKILQKGGPRIPLYIEAAIWANSGKSIPDYIASRASAQHEGIGTDDLTKLATRDFIILMINGWNEIPAIRKPQCVDFFNDLISIAPALVVAVTSRTWQDSISLASKKRVALRGLQWSGISDVIFKELDESAAKSLIEVLAKDTRLRHAARSPLMLRGLIAQAQAGTKTSENVYDILGAVVANLESVDQRKHALASEPVFEMHQHYLEELACALNTTRAVYCSRNEALAAISAAAKHLVEIGTLTIAPQAPLILNVLASFHIVQITDGSVGFTHQRFQEYYAATRLIRIIGLSTGTTDVLRHAINEPAWAESLELVAGKLKGFAGSVAKRAQLIQVAATIDLTYACELAGLSGFNESDDPELHRTLVSSVDRISSSGFKDIRDLAIVCQISSRFTAFADKLWSILESDETNTRLFPYQASNLGISLSQLGLDAEKRINDWPPSRRSDLIKEVSDNPDNFDFIVRVANEDVDFDVRATAISMLFWNYPASNAGIEAWLNAPVKVQISHDLMYYIEEYLEQGISNNDVRLKLREIESSEISDDARLRLATLFPDVLGESTINVVLDALKRNDNRDNYKELVSVARKRAPERLLTIAVELVLGPTELPEWARALLFEAEEQVREMAFERAWTMLHSEIVPRLNASSIGPLATRDQINRSVTTWLACRLAPYNSLTHVERERSSQIGYFLAHANGNDIFNSVMDLGTAASYEQAVELVDLLRIRVSCIEGQLPKNPWSMSPGQFQLLFNLYKEKAKNVVPPQDSLFTKLSSIASYVAPSKFDFVLLEALRRHLEAWDLYQVRLKTWMLAPNTPRPSNPIWGNELISSFSRWGIDAMPHVLGMMSHPSALQIVPGIISEVASLPWRDPTTKMMGSIESDVREGKLRIGIGRSLHQPTNEYQAVTDEAAKAIAKILDSEVASQLSAKEVDTNWNGKAAGHHIGQVLVALANLPSPEIVVSVTNALSTGLTGIYIFVSALRCLLRQGWVFSDKKVVNQFEAMFEKEKSTYPSDQSRRFALVQCCQLMFYVDPSAVLEKPLSHYLDEWVLMAGLPEVMRVLGQMNTDQAWHALLGLRSRLPVGDGQLAESFASALSSALSPKNFAEFVNLIEEGALGNSSHSYWNVRSIAQSIISITRDSPQLLRLLEDACRKNPSSFNLDLYGRVIFKLSGSDENVSAFLAEFISTRNPAQDDMFIHWIVSELFERKLYIGDNAYERIPKASNSVRLYLYNSAKSSGQRTNLARRILAELEFQRRAHGRPPDEPRHPSPNDGLSWTDIFLKIEVN